MCDVCVRYKKGSKSDPLKGAGGSSWKFSQNRFLVVSNRGE